MPVYNVSAFVTEAVKSILNQTYTDFELLIINDGSTDKTWDEVLKITDKRILLVENEKNIGLANTLNRGVELARGKYIARMDGDDISMPDRLEKQYKLLENNPDIDICGAGYEFFGSRNYKVIYPEKHENIKIGLFFGCCMIIPLFRRSSIIESNLRYDQQYFPAEDYRFWTECITKGLKMYNIPDVLFRYRMHPSQVSEVITNQPQITVQVRTLYFRSLFPKANESLTNQFINEFVATPIKQLSDIEEHKKIILMLDVMNQEQTGINARALEMQLKKHFSIKLANYVNEYWFGAHYSLIELFKLFPTGVFFKLPVKFRTKLILKCFIGKNRY